MHASYKIYGDFNDYRIFKAQRSKCKILIKEAYNRYVDSVEDNILLDPSNFWNHINPTFKQLPLKMTHGKDTFSTPQDIANGFSKYFSSLYCFDDSIISNNLPLSYDDRIFNSFSISSDLLLHKLKTISFSTPGPDGIHSLLLSNCSDALLQPLHYIFNLILSSGCFPSEWRNTFFIPVHKKNSKEEISNYRPIAKVSHFAKLFDSILEIELSNFFQPILHNAQHGFIRNRSTSSNLATYVSDISASLNRGFQVDSIYTDFRSAFDSVNHRLLIHKLSYYGINGTMLNLLGSFLCNRFFRVNIGGVLSDPILIVSGVPQGSHCGSLLFNIFINDLPLCIKYADVLLFADDLKIYMEISSSSDVDLLQHDLDSLYDWCMRSGLNFNLSKCCVISFSRHSSLLVDYIIDGVVLNRVDSVNDLGVIFDFKLTFGLHVQSVTSKALFYLGVLFRRTRHLRRPISLITLYYSFVRSHIIYCSVIWTPFYKTNFNKLESVQHRFLRMLSYKTDDPLPRFSHDYTSIAQKFSIPSITSFHNYQDSLFLFKVFRSFIDCPDLLSSINIYVPPRCLRLSPNFSLFTTTLMSSDFGRRSVINRCSNVFRLLSRHVDLNTASLFQFKMIAKLTFFEFI